jgi:hypothetical protein
MARGAFGTGEMAGQASIGGHGHRHGHAYDGSQGNAKLAISI